MNIQRFKPVAHAAIQLSESGEYIKYEDYVALEEKYAELEIESSVKDATIIELKQQYSRLQEARYNTKAIKDGEWPIDNGVIEVYSVPPVSVMPAELHPDTQNLVADFCTALAEKLYKAQLKYGYDADWKQDGWATQCQSHFHQHIAKGDPRDVAAYCAFMWYHGWKTESVSVPVVPDDYQHLKNVQELYHAQEKRLFTIAKRIKGPAFDKYAHSPSQAIDVLESAIFGENEEPSRAAMQQPENSN